MAAPELQARMSNCKDIYLPNWLARYNKEIYTVIVLIAIAILIYRLII